MQNSKVFFFLKIKKLFEPSARGSATAAFPDGLIDYTAQIEGEGKGNADLDFVCPFLHFIFHSFAEDLITLVRPQS